mgnify:CR=1 FL=1
MCKGVVNVLASERRETIKTLIKEKKHLKISELSQLLDVSEMTIHRDVKVLVEQGFVTKTFGGIQLNEQEDSNHSNTQCAVCHRPIQDYLSYRLILADGTIEHTCCCHCGLIRHFQKSNQVIQAICTDFLLHTTISAVSAHFVLGTTIDCQCCQPQVLPFDKKEDADKFVKGFGGEVYTFDEAMNEMVSAASCSCCQKND